MKVLDALGITTLSVVLMEILIPMNVCYVLKTSEYKLEFLFKMFKLLVFNLLYISSLYNPNQNINVKVLP